MVVTESAPEPTLALVGPAPARPIRVRRIDGRDVLMVGGSALSALALTWLVYERLTPLSGALGFWVCWYLAFLAMTGTANLLAYDAVRARDRIATVVLWSVGIGVITPLLLVVGYTIARGFHALRVQFFLEDQQIGRAHV